MKGHTPWDAALAQELARLAARRRHDADSSERLWRLYRGAVAHLAGPAGRRGGGGALAPTLAAFGRLYRGRGPVARDLPRALAAGLPRAVRAEARWVALAAAVYAAAAVVAGLATASSPAWGRVLLPTSIRAHLAQAGPLHPALAPAPALVFFLFFHNVLASAAAYAGGLLAGLGALAALLINGGLLGALAGWATAHGQGVAFWSLIAPHGTLELPATFCAGGGGLAMGAAFLAPGEDSRPAALAAALARTAPLFAACVAWLGAAALIEGLFTPQPIAPAWKLGAAAALLAAFCAYLLLGGRAVGPRPAAPPPSAATPGPLPPLHPVPDRRPGRSAPPGTRAPSGRPRPAGTAGGIGAAAATRPGRPVSTAFRLPEGLLLEPAPAGVPSRVLALLLDTALLFGGAGLIAAAAAAAGLPPSPAALAALGALVALLFFGLYGFLCEWLGGGATPGKRLVGLVVLRADGRPAGAGPLLARNLLRVVDFLPALYLLGLVSAVGSGGVRRLGDWAAGTVVVHLPRPAPPARGRRTLPRVPLPRPRLCGPLPAAAGLPPGARAHILRAYRRGQGVPPALAAAGLARPGHPEDLEHLAAALDRAGLAVGRWGPTPPRARAEELAPLAPGPAALRRLPDDLAASVAAYWGRLPSLTGPARARVAAHLGDRLGTALGLPAGQPALDPDALVEHVAHLLAQE